MAWNVKREHPRLSHRSHYVISNGGTQPNVVPQLASAFPNGVKRIRCPPGDYNGNSASRNAVSSWTLARATWSSWGSSTRR